MSFNRRTYSTTSILASVPYFDKLADTGEQDKMDATREQVNDEDEAQHKDWIWPSWKILRTSMQCAIST